jgi:hypothetical protein
MRWIDVCGPPGSGKSTLCDHLWPPRTIEYDGHGLPKEWDDWWGVCVELLDELKDHPTYRLLLGMTLRSMRKMATVYRRNDEAVYIQTGLAQRGLGFGWRLQERGKVQMLRRYFRLMPVSLGIAVVTCPVDVAASRNKSREERAETAHENRAHMVPLMLPAIALLEEVMAERGVPLARIDSTLPVGQASWDLLQFAADQATEATEARSGGQVAAVPLT